MTFLYRTILQPLFQLFMRGAALASPKVRRGLAGRREWRAQLAALEGRAREGSRVHFHAASVGEFEQAKPLIEALRGDAPGCTITASFFSPSGYEQQGAYDLLDAASYLPHDRPGEMNDFLDRLAPDLIVIIRYDLWLEFLLAAKRRGVPVVLVCGVLRSDSRRFLPVARSFFERLYGLLTLAHLVSDADADALRRLAPGLAMEVSGDTRYDRVLARSRAVADVRAFTPELIAGRAVLIAGSTWPPDEELLAGLRDRKDLLLVIVPHEPSSEHVAGLRGKFPGARTLSEIERGESTEGGAVIVDRTGILSALYRIGTIAYVGGGFGDGVHSVLEPAAYGMPVLSGPRVDRSRDASEMRDRGVLAVVRDAEELRARVEELIRDSDLLSRRRDASRSFVEERAGATERIMESLLREIGNRK